MSETETGTQGGVGDADAITVYWRPGCPFCMKLRTQMWLYRLPRREVDIWQDPAAAAFVRSVADGNETVPTVAVGERSMVNPSIGQVVRAVREQAPQLTVSGKIDRGRLVTVAAVGVAILAVLLLLASL